MFGIGVAGIAIGHWLSYLVAVPDPHARFDLLERTGHSYLPFAVQAALIACLAGIGTIFVRHLHGRRDEGAPGLGSLFRRLVLMQITLFSAIEIVERVAAGAPLGEILQDNLFVIGLAVQVIVSGLGAVVLRWLHRAARQIADAFSTRQDPRLSRTGFLLPASTPPPVPALCGGTGIRGPPSS